MGTLSLNLIKSALSEAELAKVAKAKKVEFSKKAGEVKAPTDPANKLTKIKQIEVTGKELPVPGKGTAAPGNTRSANDVVDDVPFGIKTTVGKKDKELKPSVARGPKPKQEPSLKTVSEGKTDIPDAGDVLTNLPTGTSALGGDGSGKKTPTLKAPKAKTIASTTRPKSKVVKAPGEKASKTISQIKGPKGELPKPSDAPAAVKFDVTKSKNLVESGVQVFLNNQPKSKFGIVGTQALSRLVENYRGFGYEVELRKTSDAAWRKDDKLRSLMRESVDAKYNGLDELSEEIRGEALKRFKQIVEKDYSPLYESRDEFTAVVVDAFKQISNSMEKSYLKSLNIYECQVRFEDRDGINDAEIVTEATDESMAVRQIASRIAEEYGIGADIKHIFVEGVKFKANEITPWMRKK